MPNFLDDTKSSLVEDVNKLKADIEVLDTNTITHWKSDGKMWEVVSKAGKHELSTDHNDNDIANPDKTFPHMTAEQRPQEQGCNSTESGESPLLPPLFLPIDHNFMKVCTYLLWWNFLSCR